MDWNRDGKHDWQDDAIYNNLINPDRGPQDTASSKDSLERTYSKGHQDFGPIYTEENRAAAENDEWVQSILQSRERVRKETAEYKATHKDDDFIKNVLESRERFKKEQDELYKAHPEWARKERPKDDFGQISKSNQNTMPSAQKQSYDNSSRQFELKTLGKIVIIMTALLCGVAIGTGNIDLIGSLLGICGFAFLIAVWLDG